MTIDGIRPHFPVIETQSQIGSTFEYKLILSKM